jgi:hypothetical protein
VPHDGGNHLGILGPCRCIDPGLHQTGPDSIDSHAVSTKLRRQCARKAEHAVLRCRIRSRVAPAHLHERLNQTDIDYACVPSWGEVERALTEVQEITSRLLREVGDKAREKMLAPTPDARDRGWGTSSIFSALQSSS